MEQLDQDAAELEAYEASLHRRINACAAEAEAELEEKAALDAQIRSAHAQLDVLREANAYRCHTRVFL